MRLFLDALYSASALPRLATSRQPTVQVGKMVLALRSQMHNYNPVLSMDRYGLMKSLLLSGLAFLIYLKETEDGATALPMLSEAHLPLSLDTTHPVTYTCPTCPGGFLWVP